ncbi:MAG: hypothetical protein PHU14_10795 [Methylovulum sp.]|nr:hypothetical protein [Methylovulum sp.]
MSLFRYFCPAGTALKRYALLIGWSFWLAVLPVGAFTLTAQVTDGGGRIAALPHGIDCAPYCTIETSAKAMAHLFAIPDKGYRLQGWEGGCADTLGPLCTLKVMGNSTVVARFVKAPTSQKPAKVLLLLHGEGVKHTVWNEFVKQRFNNRCPVIYGGVVLGDDAFDPDNKVYCYRIAFGYYDMLNLSMTGHNPPKPPSSTRLGYEVRAAVLGVLDRHPNASLTLVGQARGAVAAQAFLQTDCEERKHIVGLLALEQNAPNNTPALTGLLRTASASPRHTATLTLKATPEEDAQLSAALAQLNQSWWLGR